LSQSEHPQGQILVTQYTELEVALAESFAKEPYLDYFCEYNSYTYTKHLFITGVKDLYHLIIKIEYHE
jgi:hypothetical protein